MGIFDFLKAKTCTFCGGKTSLFTGITLADKAVICKDCRNKCSAFVKLQPLTQEEVKAHMEYMARQNELATQVFDKVTTRRSGITQHLLLADELAMFKVVTGESKKHTVQEVFRYDQIKSYEPFLTEHKKAGADDNCAYDEAGVKLILFCSNRKLVQNPLDVADPSPSTHPWVREIKLVVDKQVQNSGVNSAKSRIRDVIRDLDKIFGVPVKRSIFSAFDSKEKMELQAAVQVVRGLGKMAKAAVKKEDISEGAELSKDGLLDFITKNRSKYTRLANAAEAQLTR